MARARGRRARTHTRRSVGLRASPQPRFDLACQRGGTGRTGLRSRARRAVAATRQLWRGVCQGRRSFRHDPRMARVARLH